MEYLIIALLAFSFWAPAGAPGARENGRPVRTAATGSCRCSGNLYNCKDFRTQAEAQACYEKCLRETGRDVHRLDRDKDGIACEALD